MNCIRFRSPEWHIKIVTIVHAEAAYTCENTVKTVICVSSGRFLGSGVCGICLMCSGCRLIWNGSGSLNGSGERDMMLLSLRGDLCKITKIDVDLRYDQSSSQNRF